MHGMKRYELEIDTDGAGPIEVVLQGSLEAAGEMEGIYALIAGYVLQAEEAKARLLHEEDAADGRGGVVRVVVC